jgi:hypothetical protein
MEQRILVLYRIIDNRSYPPHNHEDQDGDASCCMIHMISNLHQLQIVRYIWRDGGGVPLILYSINVKHMGKTARSKPPKVQSCLRGWGVSISWDLLLKSTNNKQAKTTNKPINLYVGLHFDVATSGICCVSLRFANFVMGEVECKMIREMD